MSNEKHIKTIADFIALSEDEFERIAPDFCQFVFMARELKKIHGDNIIIDEFIWIDDGESELKYIDFVNQEDGSTKRISISE